MNRDTDNLNIDSIYSIILENDNIDHNVNKIPQNDQGTKVTQLSMPTKIYLTTK
jgi:hypothetical protein